VYTHHGQLLLLLLLRTLTIVVLLGTAAAAAATAGPGLLVARDLRLDGSTGPAAEQRVLVRVGGPVPLVGRRPARGGPGVLHLGADPLSPVGDGGMMLVLRVMFSRRLRSCVTAAAAAAAAAVASMMCYVILISGAARLLQRRARSSIGGRGHCHPSAAGIWHLI